MIYQDFDLLIDRSGDKLRAQVLNSPAGQAMAEFCLPFSDDKLENFLLRLGRTRRQTRRVESQEMNTAKTFGASLFDAVFSGDVKACFRSSIDEARRQNAGLRIRLRLGDPSVVDLPWEFLYNRSVNRFIALSVHTPLVRYMDLPERIQPIAVKPPIRVLVMISSPSDFPSLDVEGEWTRLNESLADRVAAGQLAIERLETASLEALQRKLRRQTYHIFHFIGHGEFDQTQQEGVLVLEAENQRGHKVDSQFLGMLLHDHESLRVAILNACEGARTSRTDPFAGSAQSLVQQGIPAVIAMQFEIADDVASRFAHEFYGALADGYPIDASLTEARKSIFAAGREVEWGTPVLYLRAPDGRIFDIEAANRPPAPVPVGSSLKGIESPNPSAADRLAHDVVAAAHAAFAGGQRLQAIDMLRRFDPATREIADALRDLTIEHQRLIDEGRRAVREKLEGHLKAAATLLASGQLTEAWGEACDALQVDGTDKRAIALEGRIRKVLDDQAAGDFEREQQEARRVEAERAREAERAEALTRSRQAIENSVASGDLDHAEEELKRIDESYDTGAEFSDLRAHVLKLRQQMELQQDQLADEVIAQARKEFAETPAAAVELLERFSPPHPRVTAALRELRDWIAEQNERALRDAERRGEEARERQRNKEQRRRDLQQAVERIRGYVDREELTEAAAALEAAEATFGPASIFQEFRARVKAAERRLQSDDAARSAIVHGQNLAAAGDLAGAVRKLEVFGGHPEVDAVLEALRQEQRRLSRRPAWLRATVTAAAQPRVLLAAAVVIVAVVAALWLGPGVVAGWKQRGGSPQVPPAAGDRGRPAAPAVARVQTPASQPEAQTAPAPADTTAVSTGPPATAGPDATASSPEPTAVPPTAEAVAPPSPTKPAASNERLVADYKARIRALLTKRDTEQALSTLMGALGYAPQDTGLRSLAANVRQQAQGRAADERSRALRHGASGLRKFGEAERLVERGQSLARERNPTASARAYLDAAALFASCVTGVPAVVPARPAPRPFEGPAPAAETSSSSSTEPGPAVTPAVAEPPPRPRPQAATPPSVDPVIEAYAEAMSRGDRAALLAVYPTAPRDLLSELGKKGADYNMRPQITRIAKDATNRQLVSVTVFHEFVRSDEKERSENQLFVLEPKGDSWVIVQILRR